MIDDEFLAFERTDDRGGQFGFVFYQQDSHRAFSMDKGAQHGALDRAYLLRIAATWRRIADAGAWRQDAATRPAPSKITAAASRSHAGGSPGGTGAAALQAANTLAGTGPGGAASAKGGSRRTMTKMKDRMIGSA
ncbi:hypothetical protein [Massilia sp. HP4]|uniref:hypothetical protein n=1 Tax=Massilia sp. HP4 TaxID=2562316 RepID=UPI00148598A7|nr:hypothetical protein [Massilia sp. HP4]